MKQLAEGQARPPLQVAIMVRTLAICLIVLVSTHILSANSMYTEEISDPVARLHTNLAGKLIV